MYYIYQKYINTCISASDAMTTKENKHMGNMNPSDFLNQQEVLHRLLTLTCIWFRGYDHKEIQQPGQENNTDIHYKCCQAVYDEIEICILYIITALYEWIHRRQKKPTNN